MKELWKTISHLFGSSRLDQLKKRAEEIMAKDKKAGIELPRRLHEVRQSGDIQAFENWINSLK